MNLSIFYGCILSAPSSRIVSPFSIGFSTMACTSIAYSAGRPRRCGKGTVEPRNFFTLSGSEASMGVSKRPGAMVITRTPSVLRSRAIGSVIETTAP